MLSIDGQAIEAAATKLAGEEAARKLHATPKMSTTTWATVSVRSFTDLVDGMGEFLARIVTPALAVS